MKENNIMNVRSSLLDVNIEDYVKSEMQKSMILVTGIPKSFSKSKLTQGIQSTEENLQYRHSDMLKKASKSSKNFFKSRNNSYVEKQKNLLHHKHQKLLEKILVPCDKQYYEKIPVKPGFMFLECLIKAPRGDINDLSINIPETIYSTDKMYYLSTLENGKVSCNTDIYGYKFVKIIEKYRNSDENTVYDKIAVVLRGMSEDLNDMDKVILDWTQFKDKMGNNEVNSYSLIQRYIRASGNRPAVTRLHYFHSIKSNKANYAYFISNIDSETSESSRTLQKCVVNTHDPAKIEVFIKSGSSIKYYENEAKKIVEYLNKGYNIRIEEIVLDFLTDSTGVIWISGCKGCRVDETTLINALPSLKEWWPDHEEIPKGKKQESQYLMNFVHCKLCRLYYTNNQLSHLVSVRMLMLFKAHSIRRVELPLDTAHLKVTSNDMLSQSVRICQYCYMLVTTEFELIKAEETFARTLNIPKQQVFYEDDPRLEVEKHFLPKKMVQWRLLVLVSRLYDLKITESCPELYFHIKFNDILTKFRIKIKKCLENNEEVLILDLIKLHYIYSAEGKSLEKLINSDILELRLTKGEKYEDKVIGTSKTECLLGLTGHMSISSALYTKKQILLFDENDKKTGNLSVFIGLSCDKIFLSSKIKVSLNKIHEVYIPELHYITTDPLPIEWMELLGEDDVQNESFGTKIEDSDFYKPLMTKAEMIRMEDITSPYAAIPKIYSERTRKSIPTQQTSDALSVYKAVDDYLKITKPKHSKTSSWSAGSTKRSLKTADTARITPKKPILKKKQKNMP
jgi:hypothetical protein